LEHGLRLPLLALRELMLEGKRAAEKGASGSRVSAPNLTTAADTARQQAQNRELQS